MTTRRTITAPQLRVALRALVATPLRVREATSRFLAYGRAVEAMRMDAVPEPHWYLAGIGVDPTQRRRGIGRTAHGLGGGDGLGLGGGDGLGLSGGDRLGATEGVREEHLFELGRPSRLLRTDDGRDPARGRAPEFPGQEDLLKTGIATSPLLVGHRSLLPPSDPVLCG